MVSVRRNFGVTFEDVGHPGVMDCLRQMDEVAERLRLLAQQGQCVFHDATSQEVNRNAVVTYRIVFLYFKNSGAKSASSQRAANVMQELFMLCGLDGERAVRFYCADYNETPGACVCPQLVLPLRPGAPIRYKSLSEVSIAHKWLMDRADLLALTDKQLNAIDAHPNTRQQVIDFITWLRANPNVL